MPPKPNACKGCSLYETGKGFCPDKLPDGPSTLAIIGEAPGKQEIERGEPFVGSAGFILKQWGIRAVPELQQALEQQQIYFGNTLRCLPETDRRSGRNYPIGDIRRNAENHCRRYDKWPTYANSCVLLLGEIPQRYWFNSELKAEDQADTKARRRVKGVLGRVGRIYDKEGRKWIFVPHPAWILRQSELIEHLQIGLRIASRESSGQSVGRFVPVLHRSSTALEFNNGDIGLDLEWGKDERISIFGFSWDEGKTTCAFGRGDTNDSNVSSTLQRIMAEGRTIIGHNILAADLPKLREEGLLLDTSPRGSILERIQSDSKQVSQFFDTMLGLHATHAHLAGLGSYDLRSLALLYGQRGSPDKWLGLDWKDYEGDIWRTCALDAQRALYCSIPLQSTIKRLGLDDTCNLSHRLAPIFYEMRQRGVKVDVSIVRQIHQEREAQADVLRASLPLVERRKEYRSKEAKAWQGAINPRSPEIITYFKEQFGVQLKGRTREDFERISRDSGSSSEAKLLAESVAHLSKLGSDSFWFGSYDKTTKSWERIDEKGFVHPEYVITGTPDRPSCIGTNIQNFPRPSEDNRAVPLRSAVVPPEDGMVLISADFAHVESYTNAIEAGDWDRVKAIQEGKVSHERTTEWINSRFGLRLTRQQGKVVNHAFDKGESAYNLSHRLFGSSRSRELGLAQSIIQEMLAAFPKTQQFRDKLWSDCTQNPFTAVNVFGRRLKCFGRGKFGDDGQSSRGSADAARRERWKKSLAFLGRSSAVDVLLRVLCRIYYEQRLDEYSLPYMEIHDELVYAIPAEKAQAYGKIVKESFEEPVAELRGIRLPCEVHVGMNWSECK